MNSWSGSVEIGVTQGDPLVVELPACASKLQNGSWVGFCYLLIKKLFLLCYCMQVMSGTSVLMNGDSIVEFYGADLEKLSEEDRVGVMRTTEVFTKKKNYL